MAKAETALEFMQRRQADPEWRAKQQAQEEELRNIREESIREQKSLLEELAKAGYEVRTVYDLVNTSDSYPEAIPVLLKHLRQYHYSLRVREGIARALITKESKPFLRELIDAYREDPDTSLNGAKGPLGDAISYVAESRHAQEVISLALDPYHGKGRWALVEWLGRRKGGDVDKALETLTSDPEIEIATIAADALKKRARRS